MKNDKLRLGIKMNFPPPDYESSVSWYAFQDRVILRYWVVSPELFPEWTEQDKLFENAGVAAHESARLSDELVKECPCVREVFTHLNPLVVDSAYRECVSAPGFIHGVRI